MMFAYEDAESIAPSSTYSANAVHFGGSTYLSCASIAATDNGFLSFSLWEKGFLNSSNNNNPMWVIDSAGNYNPSMWVTDSLGPASELILATGDNSGNLFQPVWEGLNSYDASAWTHFLFSVDTNYGAGARIAALYVNDTLVTTPNNLGDIGVSFNSPVNGRTFMFGGDTFGDLTTMDVADVWIAPGVSLLSGTTIPEATRRQFINADLTPADPAGFPTAAVIFTGGPGLFPTNRGTGGSFSLTGSLISATPP